MSSVMTDIYRLLAINTAVLLIFAVFLVWISANLFRRKYNLDGYLFAFVSFLCFVLFYMLIAASISIAIGIENMILSVTITILQDLIIIGISVILSILTTFIAVKWLKDKPMPLFDKFH